MRVVDPAGTHAFIRQPINVFVEEQPDHEPRRHRGSASLGKQIRQFRVFPLPVDLADQPRQFVAHVDDLIEPRAKQVIRAAAPTLRWSHRQCDGIASTSAPTQRSAKAIPHAIYSVPPHSPPEPLDHHGPSHACASFGPPGPTRSASPERHGRHPSAANQQSLTARPTRFAIEAPANRREREDAK